MKSINCYTSLNFKPSRLQDAPSDPFADDGAAADSTLLVDQAGLSAGGSLNAGMDMVVQDMGTPYTWVSQSLMLLLCDTL